MAVLRPRKEKVGTRFDRDRLVVDCRSAPEPTDLTNCCAKWSSRQSQTGSNPQGIRRTKRAVLQGELYRSTGPLTRLNFTFSKAAIDDLKPRLRSSEAVKVQFQKKGVMS
jgi:hypothetical protein